MTMLCTLIRGQMSYTFFLVGGHMSSYVNCLGGRCPHMPFFIGGGAHVRGGKCPTLVHKCHPTMIVFTLTIDRWLPFPCQRWRPNRCEFATHYILLD